MALTLKTHSADDVICPNSYGFFRRGGREFVITNLATPMPWTNVMSNGRYGLVISQNGGGFSWGDNSQVSRITRWDQDLVLDRQGRFVYIQDLDSPNLVWSTTSRTTGVNAEAESVVHGLGYTVFNRTVDAVETSHTVFVPEKEPCEVWIVSLKNCGTRARRLRVASYLEWHLGASADWHREFHRLFYESGRGDGFVHARKLPGLIHESRQPELEQPYAFHGVSGLDSVEWVTDKSSFLGTPADLMRPGFLHGQKPAPENPRWNDPVAVSVGEMLLQPGESRTLVYTVGSVPELGQAKPMIERFSANHAAHELDIVRDSWKELCERSFLETGDPAVDLMANYWLKYQALGARMTARCAYYQQGGAYGFRDQLQDSLSMLTLDPGLTRKQILLHAEATYEDGAVRHWWHPNTNIFAESHHSDTCLWVPYATLAYLDETEDLSILDTTCRYLSHVTQEFGSDASLLEHCLLGVRRALSKLSPRGLPLIFSGDWNDGLSHAGIDGKGESVWLGMFLFDILSRWVPVLQDLQRTDVASEFRIAAEKLSKAVNEHGWDGDWFLQGTRDDGLPLGSRTCREGQIFLNPQTWAVISGIAPKDKATKALNSAEDRLVKPYGALLLTPAFRKLDPNIGYITRYAPGLRENGGVYSHASAWMIQALAMLGGHSEARKLFRAMLPSNGRDAEHYVAEPYVMPGNVDGPDSPFEGRAGWTWYTGSAAWMYRMALEWICGIRATRQGLLVDTRSGDAPLEFRLKREFRGDIFHFNVQGQGVVQSIQCDTAKVVDGRLQSTGQGVRHKVLVTLGE